MSNPEKHIDTAQFSQHLRSKGVDLINKRILLTNFNGSDQQKDFTLPSNCNGFGRIHHFRRKDSELDIQNPLPIDPALNFLGQPSRDEIKVQVFQNAVCSWRCWYCFVDFKLLSGNPKYSQFRSAEELMELYLQDENAPSIIDLSGGQPDLVPEWGLWMLEEIEKLGLSEKIYVWTDDNLSNDYLWKYLSQNQLRKLRAYKNYGRVGCFKGFDKDSFSFNTQASPDLFNTQFELMGKLVDFGFDVYGYATFTANDEKHISSKVGDFVDRVQEAVHPVFPLRITPLKITKFSPMEKRMKYVHEKAINIQMEALEAWENEIQKRFNRTERNKRVYEHKIKN